MARKKKRRSVDDVVTELLARGPERARVEIRAQLESVPSPALRTALDAALHGIIDAESASWLLGKRRLVPGLVRTSVLSDVYDEVASQLPSMTVTRARTAIRGIGVLGAPGAHTHGENDDPARLRGATLRLLLAIVDDRRQEDRAAAAAALRGLDPVRAERELVARWRAVRLESPMDRWHEWAWLGMPVVPEAELLALLEAVLAERTSLALPDLLATTVDRIPADVHRRLLAMFPGAAALAQALATRLVEAANTQASLVVLLEDPRLWPAHAPAARRLVEIGAPLAVLERSATLSPDVLALALDLLGPDESFRRYRRPTPDMLEALLRAPRALRTRAWFDVAPAMPDRGRELYLAMARDRQHPARSQAVDALAHLVSTSADRIEKRHGLFALGATGHPDATLPLLAALDDPDLADTGPLVCTALGACGDTRALPILRERSHGRHASFMTTAIAQIRERTTTLQRDVLAAARTDENAMIRDLAERAAGGDDEAAVVLEDALREMGRL